MKELAKKLGLAEDATEAQILEAAAKLATERDEAVAERDTAKTELADAKDASLEDRAKKENKVVLDAAKVQELSEMAERGEEAAKKLHQQDFDHAFESALDELRVDAKDETKEEWQELYDLAPSQTLKRLSALPKIASDKPRGTGKTAAGEAPEGVDEERYELHTRVLAYMDEKDEEDYVKALGIVRAKEARS